MGRRKTSVEEVTVVPNILPLTPVSQVSFSYLWKTAVRVDLMRVLESWVDSTPLQALRPLLLGLCLMTSISWTFQKGNTTQELPCKGLDRTLNLSYLIDSWWYCLPENRHKFLHGRECIGCQNLIKAELLGCKNKWWGLRHYSWSPKGFIPFS